MLPCCLTGSSGLRTVPVAPPPPPPPAAAAAAAAVLGEDVMTADRAALSLSAAVPLQAAAAASAVPLQQTGQQRVIAGVHTEPALPTADASLQRQQMQQSTDIQHKTEQPLPGVKATEAARERGRQLQEAISILLHDTD
jgi:urease accessory protein UreF